MVGISRATRGRPTIMIGRVVLRAKGSIRTLETMQDWLLCWLITMRYSGVAFRWLALFLLFVPLAPPRTNSIKFPVELASLESMRRKMEDGAASIMLAAWHVQTKSNAKTLLNIVMMHGLTGQDQICCCHQCSLHHVAKLA